MQRHTKIHLRSMSVLVVFSLAYSALRSNTCAAVGGAGTCYVTEALARLPGLDGPAQYLSAATPPRRVRP